MSPADRESTPHPARRPGVASPVVANETALSAQALIGLLATPTRLGVVAAIVLGASTPAQIVTATGLSESEVGTALNRLVRGRLVRVRSGSMSVDPNVFATAAREAAPKPEPVDYGVSDPKVAAILRAYLVDGRLTRIPVSGRKRTTVLEYLVATFEPGRRYPEVDVKAILASFHPDTAALRRYLVDEGFLTRDAGIYWRTGGWVDVL